MDIGALNVNGSPRDTVLLAGAAYHGIDLQEGPGVDEVADATHLGKLFLPSRWDAALCFDTLEHVQDWHAIISGMRYVVRPGGYIAVCAAPIGFALHEYPGDYWRFTQDNFRSLFTDCEVVAEEPTLPGLTVRLPEAPVLVAVV